MFCIGGELEGVAEECIPGKKYLAVRQRLGAADLQPMLLIFQLNKSARLPLPIFAAYFPKINTRTKRAGR